MGASPLCISEKEDIMRGKIPSPLEVIDAGASIASRVLATPAQIASNVGTALTGATQQLEQDIAKPRQTPGTPKSPTAVLGPAVSGIGHMAGGLVGAVKGGFDGVIETFEGIKSDVGALTR
ncbi:hypothetical protein LCGC14_0782100 [marine sediment metagenome]|uniref:Uncharacterized protein n=1 Tax=marine sediment metagenome TaxID=412755 RepID=A0A0F9PVF4_9ZZZZ